MKLSFVLMIALLFGCSTESGQAEAAEQEYERWVCTEFTSPWVGKDDSFFGATECSGTALCWWQHTERSANPEIRHKHFYVPKGGEQCHYETAKGRKPNEY